MEFKVLSLDDCLQVAEWRNECLYALRTPYMLTEEMQEEFYKNTVCNRSARARFWGIWEEPNKGKIVNPPRLIGMAGIENIEWENSRGEISLIIDPKYHKQGYGQEAVSRLLIKGFYELNLDNIWGVCYECNPAIYFWQKIIVKYNGTAAYFPNMKYYQASYYSGYCFNIDRRNI